jgi:hypothetical protein
MKLRAIDPMLGRRSVAPADPTAGFLARIFFLARVGSRESKVSRQRAL